MSETNIVRSKLPAETTFDRIALYWSDEESGIVLTPKEEEQSNRWDLAHSLIMNYHSTEQAAAVLKTKYGYSKATAYRDVSNAVRLFGDINKANKEGRRHILYEYSMKVFQIAANMKPPNLAEMNKAIKNMMEISGLDVNDPDMPNFADLQPHTYTMGLPPELIQVLNKLVSTGAINLSDIRAKADNPQTIDITHTEDTNGGQPGE